MSRLGATRHTYLGPGGRIIEPKSESRELDKAIALLQDSYGKSKDKEDEMIEEAVTILQSLRKQVGQGFHRNPVSKFDAGKAVRQMSDDVIELGYIHLDDDKPYKHKFDGEVEMWAIQRGDRRDVLLTRKDGKPLWEDFE